MINWVSPYWLVDNRSGGLGGHWWDLLQPCSQRDKSQRNDKRLDHIMAKVPALAYGMTTIITRLWPYIWNLCIQVGTFTTTTIISIATLIITTHNQWRITSSFKSTLTHHMNMIHINYMITSTSMITLGCWIISTQIIMEPQVVHTGPQATLVVGGHARTTSNVMLCSGSIT